MYKIRALIVYTHTHARQKRGRGGGGYGFYHKCSHTRQSRGIPASNTTLTRDVQDKTTSVQSW